jgi:hypothetical protein
VYDASQSFEDKEGVVKATCYPVGPDVFGLMG